MASQDLISSPLDRTKSLTCYFWYFKGGCIYPDEACGYAHYVTGKVAEAPVHVVPGRPAVAGANARKASPVYRDWSVVRRGRLLVPPHCARQIADIHDRQARQQTFLELPAPSPAPLLLPPAESAPIPPSRLALPAPLSPEAGPSQPASLPPLPPPFLAEQENAPMAPSLAQDIGNHLSYSRQILVENCVEALFALRSFEEDYTTRPGVVLPPLPPPERFRMAINAIIDVATAHGAALEEMSRR